MRAIVTILLLICIAATALLGWDVYRFFNSPLASSTAQTVQVKPGSSFAAINRQLLTRNVFSHGREAKYFSAWARLRGVAQKVHSGEYEIKPGMTPLGLLEAMAAGRTLQYRLTIVEGWTFEQLRAAVESHEALEASLQGEPDSAIMSALDKPEEMAEGRFLPDTYQFPRGTKDIDFYRRAYNAMEKVLAREWEKRGDDLAIESPYEALILASIVEKETAVEAERTQISGVFSRRLKIGMPLQTDPTVIYGATDYDGDLRRSHLRSDTPFNTYTRRGLTPTPIALPGQAAIHASLHPAPGEALYFVSRGDGSHVFSATLDEHNAAVRKYQLKQ